MKNKRCHLLISPVLLVGLWACPAVAHDMSPEEKMQLLGELADQGDANAHFLMAYEHAVGNQIDAIADGTPKDPVKALALFHDAADLGNPGAQLLLSHYYDVGFGVKPDKAQAYMWALLAVTHGSPVAKQLMPDFEKTLTPEQHAEGQRLAKAWKVTAFEAHEAEHGHAHHKIAEPLHHGHGHGSEGDVLDFADLKSRRKFAPESAPPPHQEVVAPDHGHGHHEGHDAPGHDHGHPHGQATTEHGHGHPHGGASEADPHAPTDQGSAAP